MRALREVLRSPLLYLAATLAVAAAACRVALLCRRRAFDDLVGGLRAGTAKPRALGTLRAQARVAGRLLPILPPWGMGSCLKRSLILLHLWSRAGLEPRVHLGFRPPLDELPRGHAWLSVEEPELADLCGRPGECSEVLVL